MENDYLQDCPYDRATTCTELHSEDCLGCEVRAEATRNIPLTFCEEQECIGLSAPSIDAGWCSECPYSGRVDVDVDSIPVEGGEDALIDLIDLKHNGGN